MPLEICCSRFTLHNCHDCASNVIAANKAYASEVLLSLDQSLPIPLSTYVHAPHEGTWHPTTDTTLISGPRTATSAASTLLPVMLSASSAEVQKSVSGLFSADGLPVDRSACPHCLCSLCIICFQWGRHVVQRRRHRLCVQVVPSRL